MSPARKQPRKAPRVILVTIAVVLNFIGCYYARLWLQTQAANPEQHTSPCKDYQRIVALSPSIVEIIYLLGLDNQLVGVPRYSNYPPEAKEKQRIGGYVDLDYEKLISLRPDCVILLEEQAALSVKLEQLGIHTIVVSHDNIKGIIKSVDIIGNELGQATRALEIVSGINTAVIRQTSKHENMLNQPRVLISISRDTTADHPSQVIIAGSAGFHRELLHLIGTRNAYQGSVSFPMLSREKLIQLDPDIILDLVNTETWNKLGQQRLLDQWNSYKELKAVKHNRVVIIPGDQHLIPGPRFPQTLERFAHAIHH